MTKTKTSNECMYNDTGVYSLLVILFSFKLTHALWTCFSRDFVSMTGAGVPPPSPLDCRTFGMTFRRQFAAAAIASRLVSHYFPSLFFQCYLCSVAEREPYSTERVRGQEDEGKDAGQNRLYSCVQPASSENSPPPSHLNSGPLQLSVKRWPSVLTVIWIGELENLLSQEDMATKPYMCKQRH